MAAKEDLINKYAESSRGSRFNIICKTYSFMLRLLDGEVNGLVYRITEERAWNHRQEIGDPCVRIQVSQLGDPTANKGTDEIMIRRFIDECSFEQGYIDGLEDASEILDRSRKIFIMRADYKLFNDMMAGHMDDIDLNILKSYLSKKKSLSELADDRGVSYNTMAKKILSLKRLVRDSMDQYWNRSIA